MSHDRILPTKDELRIAMEKARRIPDKQSVSAGELIPLIAILREQKGFSWEEVAKWMGEMVNVHASDDYWIALCKNNGSRSPTSVTPITAARIPEPVKSGFARARKKCTHRKLYPGLWEEVKHILATCGPLMSPKDIDSLLEAKYPDRRKEVIHAYLQTWKAQGKVVSCGRGLWSLAKRA